MIGQCLKVLLVDDDPLVLDTLGKYFATTHDIEVVASVSNGAEALAALDRLERVDIILADIHMPTMDGPSLLAEVRKRPNPPVFLAVTAFDSDRAMLQILRLGGAGFILKSQRPASIIEAVREVSTGGMVVSPQSMVQLVKHLGADAAPTKHDPIREAMKLTTLTDGERQVLNLLCRGYSNAEICELLLVSNSTVKKHVSSLLVKFGATSRLNLVVRVLGAEYFDGPTDQ